MKFVTTLAAALLLTSPVLTQEYPTIVGEWYAEQTGASDCGGPHAVHIQAMSYVEESLVCTFDDVSRDGWTVTWNGTCSDGASRDPVQVIAQEDGGKLSMSFNGNPGWSTLRRCAADRGEVSQSEPASVPLHYARFAGHTATAAKYWPDEVETISEIDGEYALRDKLTVYVAKLHGYEFALASSILSCGTGSHGCPLRLIKDGSVLGELSACQDVASHAVTSDGRFLDCNGGTGRPLRDLIGKSWPADGN